jgi:hypothetical protein
VLLCSVQMTKQRAGHDGSTSGGFLSQLIEGRDLV